MNNAQKLYLHLTSHDCLFTEDIREITDAGELVVKLAENIGLGEYESPNEIEARRVLSAFMLGWQYHE